MSINQPNEPKTITLPEEQFISWLNRLETAITKIEKAPVTQISPMPTFLTTEDLAACADYWNKVIQKFISLINIAKTSEIDCLEKLTDIILESICAQQDILLESSNFQKPQNKEMKRVATKMISFKTRALDWLRENNNLKLQIELTDNAFDIYDWLFTDGNCEHIVNSCWESMNRSINKINAMKNNKVTEWAKMLFSIFSEISVFIKTRHKTGLWWSNHGDSDIFNLLLKIGNTYRANFRKQNNENETFSNYQLKVNENLNQIHKEIAAGDIKSHLKPVKDTGSNSKIQKVTEATTNTIHQSRVSITDNNSDSTDNSKQTGPGMRKRWLSKGKKDHYEEINHLILYENFDGLIKDINPDILTMKTIWRISNCVDCTFRVSERINRIIILNCEDVRVICNSLISNVELINNTKIKLQSGGNINMANIDGCKEVLLHLSNESAHIPTYVINSTEVKIRVVMDPNNKTEYKDYIIPEQFVFRVNEDMKLTSKVSDWYNY